MGIFFNRKKKVELETGVSKPIEDLNLDDLIKNPIWIWALDEEEIEGQDETWLKPILNSLDVRKDMVEAYILLKVEKLDFYVSAHIDIDEIKLDDIGFWKNSEWVTFNKDDDFDYPLNLVSIPSIRGKESVRFILNRGEDFCFPSSEVK